MPVLIIAALLWGLDPTDAANDLPVACSILAELKVPSPLSEAVCRMIRDLDSGVAEQAPLEYELLVEADRLAAGEAASRAG